MPFAIDCKPWAISTDMSSQTAFAPRRLFANIGTLLSASVITKFISAGTTILLARQVGVASFGEYAAAMALLRIASIAFALGLDAWLLRNGYRDGKIEQLVIYTTINLLVKVVLGGLWLLLISIGGIYLFSAIYTPALFIGLAVAIWLEELANTVWGACQAALRNRATFLLTILFHGLILIGTLSLIIQGTTEILPFVIARVVAAGVGSALALWWFMRTLGIERISQQTMTQVQWQLRATIPFGISAALSLIYGRADTAIVAQWLGGEAAGLYASAMSLMAMALLMPLAIYLVMLPILSRAHAERSPMLLRLTKQMVGCNVVAGLVCGLILALLADPAIQLFYGRQYAQSSDLLTIFSGVLALRFVSFALAVFLTAVGWQTKRTAIQAVVAAANVGLNLWVVTRWGVTGVATVYFMTELLLLIGYLLFVIQWWRQHGVSWQPPSLQQAQGRAE